MGRDFKSSFASGMGGFAFIYFPTIPETGGGGWM
jgi:hypothetical protein